MNGARRRSPTYVRIKGSGRYAPGQTEPQVIADMRAVLADLEKRFPGLKATITPEHQIGRPMMPPFEVAEGVTHRQGGERGL